MFNVEIRFFNNNNNWMATTIAPFEAVEYMMFDKDFDDEDCLEKIKERG